MGILLDKLKLIELGSNNSNNINNNNNNSCNTKSSGNKNSNELNKKPTQTSFNSGLDLDEIPPELSLQILKYLNATDLCLASCVWSSLANDDILWKSLCQSTWGYASIYVTNNCNNNNYADKNPKKTYRSIFMHLDEATLTFNAIGWRKGLDYLFKQKLVANDSMEIARFVNSTKKLSSEEKQKLFRENKQVLENVIILHNYENQFLPTALRRFFSKIEAPKERNSYLSLLLEKFSKRFCSCNPDLGLSEEAVYILCFSLILLSVDLSSPAVKNKMSKREFIRNTRNALPSLNSDFTGHLYDNIYLNGNIAASRLEDELMVTAR